MSATLKQVREALAESLAGIDGLRTLAYMPDQLAVGPRGTLVIVIDPSDEVVRYAKDFDDALTYTLRARLVLGSTSERAAQDELDEYLAPSGDRSIRARLEGYPALGGLVDYVVVTAATGYGEYPMGDVRYLGAEWLIEVAA